MTLDRHTSLGRFRVPSRCRQEGVAVITALLLTTLAVTIVASLFWQQQVQVRSIENQRMQLQKQWILRGALDWAGLILRESYRSAIGGTTTLQQPWAVGLAETRLDSYVENGQPNSEASDATITGKIIDAQSLLNLNNLAANGVPSQSGVAAFKRLLSALGLEPALADAAARSVAAGQPRTTPVQGTTPPPPAVLAQQLSFAYVEDLLAVPGFTPEIVKTLRGSVIFLSGITEVNVNTASAEVLHALVGDALPLEAAKALILDRDKIPFKDLPNLRARYPGVFDALREGTLNVKSTHFLVDGKVKLNRAGLDVRALIKLDGGQNPPTTKIIWVRENQ